MIISKHYRDNLRFSNIKYNDGSPLLSEDLHEYEDISSERNSHIFNNLIGCGILNNPTITKLSDTKISLSEPISVMIQGEVVLIQADYDDSENTPTLYKETLSNKTGYIYAVGHMVNKSSNSRIHSYGCLQNRVINPNPLYNPEFNIGVSSRLQFEWYIPETLMSEEVYNTSDKIESINDTVKELLSNDLSEGHIENVTINVLLDPKYKGKTKSNKVFIINNDWFIIPLIHVYTDNNHVTKLDICPRVTAGFPIILSPTEPQGTFNDGTIWFNTSSNEFYLYLNEEIMYDQQKMITKKSNYESLIITDDSTEEMYILGINKGDLYINKL